MAANSQAPKQPLRLVETIPLPGVKGRLDHMDVDVKGKRLFVAGLENGSLEVVDLQTGKRTQSIPGFKKPQRIYVSGGRGFDVGSVWVYEQKDADHYELLGKVPTRPGAGTSFWSPELNRYYVAAPANDKEDAAVLVYEPQP